MKRVLLALALLLAGLTACQPNEDPLAWEAPPLVDPAVRVIPATGGSYSFAEDQDAVLGLAGDVIGKVVIRGGRNVVLYGFGHTITTPASMTANGVLEVHAFSGTAHLVDLTLDPGGVERDAIRITSTFSGSIAQVQRIHVETVRGTYAGFHGDILQTWAGPSVLRVDRLTGSSTYQGMYLAPRHFAPGGMTYARPWLDVRNTDLRMVGDGYTLFALSDQGGDTDASWISMDDVTATAFVDGCPDDAGDDDFQAHLGRGFVCLWPIPATQ